MPAIVPPNQQEKPNPLNTVVLFLLLFFIYLYVVRTFFSPKPEVPVEQGTLAEIDSPANVAIEQDPSFKPVADATLAATAAAEPSSQVEFAPMAASLEAPESAPAVPESAPAAPAQWVTLGSMDNSRYSMLLTFSSQGAALVRAEMSSIRYQDLFDETGYKYQNNGYFGHVFAEIPLQTGTRDQAAEVNKAREKCEVVVVPSGTPAAESGLQKGDTILECNGKRIADRTAWNDFMNGTQPGQKIALKVSRNGQEVALNEVALRPMPMSVIRPEGYNTADSADPLSFLMTLQQLDGASVSNVLPSDSTQSNAAVLDSYLNREIKGLSMRNGNWEVASATESKVVFRYPLPQYGLEVYKTYQLSPKDNETSKTKSSQTPDASNLLSLSVSIKNTGALNRQVAYRLDGPTGLPLEGYWFTHKVWRTWSGVGLRDVVYKQAPDFATQMISCTKIAADKWETVKDLPLQYLGVDAAYFGAYLMPCKAENGVPFTFSKFQPLRVSTVDKKWINRTDCSFRALSQLQNLKPGEQMEEQFNVFIGPKQPELLGEHGLGGVLYYGWFGWIAVPLISILHFFYMICGNYGIAILLLTAVVRLLMHPLSRKQVMGALKMQKLQPEMAKIKEKYKEPQDQMRAQQELFRRHNYNPLSGCLVVFIQLPIFMALYRVLMVDVELRQASMFGSSIRFLSNLAAPDMMIDWTSWMPQWVTSGYGMFGLGPYFNILPIATIFLFIAQQKILMPPPADEQARIQQKVMNFMMIFMGLLFFKIAAGLCIYFIASSVWGLAERQFMPKELVDEAIEEDEKARYMKPERKKLNNRPENDDPMEVLKSWTGAFKKLTGKADDEKSGKKNPPTDNRRRKR